MRIHQTAKCILCSTLLLLSLLLLANVVPSASALPGNSLWIEPTEVDLTTAGVGTKFNITVWLNVSTPTASWQFYLIYNRTYLNVTRCVYTGSGKSQWAGTASAASISARIDDFHNDTFKYVLHGESLMGGVERTGAGSLSWVEFEVIDFPENGTLSTGEFRVDVEGPTFKTELLNALYENVAIDSFGISTYVIPEFQLSTLIIAILIAAAFIAVKARRKPVVLRSSAS